MLFSHQEVNRISSLTGGRAHQLPAAKMSGHQNCPLSSFQCLIPMLSTFKFHHLLNLFFIQRRKQQILHHGFSEIPVSSASDPCQAVLLCSQRVPQVYQRDLTPDTEDVERQPSQKRAQGKRQATGNDPNKDPHQVGNPIFYSMFDPSLPHLHP